MATMNRSRIDSIYMNLIKYIYVRTSYNIKINEDLTAESISIERSVR